MKLLEIMYRADNDELCGSHKYIIILVNNLFIGICET